MQRRDDRVRVTSSVWTSASSTSASLMNYDASVMGHVGQAFARRRCRHRTARTAPVPVNDRAADRDGRAAGRGADHQRSDAIDRGNGQGGFGPGDGVGGHLWQVLGRGCAGRGRPAGASGASACASEGFTCRRTKNDLRDSSDLADLLRMGRLPEVWVAPPRVREMRELVRHRAKLVGLRSGQEETGRPRAGDATGRADQSCPGQQRSRQSPEGHTRPATPPTSSYSLSPGWPERRSAAARKWPVAHHPV